MRISRVAVSLAFLTLTAPMAAAEESDHPGRLRELGAHCIGRGDDTAAFRAAIAATPAGGVLFVPPGRCILSDTIVISGTHPVSIVGAGIGSQIYQSTDRSLFQLQGASAIAIRSLYLGSAAVSPDTALLFLLNSHRNVIENVTMLGSNVGLNLQGSLLNTMTSLRSGTNFGGFFAPTSPNQVWVKGRRFNNISANANSFFAPLLEGGVNGIDLLDTNGEGGLNITGGTIEGVSGTGLRLQTTFLPSAITAVHFEANGAADITLQQVNNVRISAIFSTRQISLLGDTRNVTISDSATQNIFLDIGNNQYPLGTGVKRIILENLTTAFANCNAGVVPPPTGGIGATVPGQGPSNPFPTRPDIIYTNIGLFCSGG